MASRRGLSAGRRAEQTGAVVCRYDDLPAEAKPETYPRYYRRTFHWQSDGWLSDRSARIYDASVEYQKGGTPLVIGCSGRCSKRASHIGLQLTRSS